MVQVLADFYTGKIARYKLPRRVIIQSAIPRSPAGEQDLRWAKAVLAETWAG